MEKEFVPYELALELKELGFDEECLDCYNHKGNLWGMRLSQQSTVDGACLAPLYQQAFRWFRENKLSDCYVYRYQERTDGSINYGYSILNNFGIEETRFIKENYTSYEDAELACLKHLIKIINEKD
jgi:hypothetical protein